MGLLRQGADAPRNGVEVRRRRLGQRDNLPLQRVEGRQDGARQPVGVGFRQGGRADADALLEEDEASVKVGRLGQRVALLVGRRVCDRVGSGPRGGQALWLRLGACLRLGRRRQRLLRGRDAGMRFDAPGDLVNDLAQGGQLLLLRVAGGDGWLCGGGGLFPAKLFFGFGDFPLKPRNLPVEVLLVIFIA